METCHNCGERLTEGARFCAACGAHADSDETRVSSDAARFASEETRIAEARPRAVQPLSVRPLSQMQEPRARNLQTDEQTIFTVRPTLLFVKLGYLLAALGGIALVALATWGLGRLGWSVSPFILILLALSLLLIPAFKHLKRNMLRYTLTDSKIEIDEGLISRTTRNIPLRNIQDVTVTTTIPQRLMRFGNVVIDNASETGGTTVLKNIPDPRRHADLILRELRRWH